MNREQIISNYIDAVERVLVAFHFNMEPQLGDIRIITLETKKFTNALRELYLSNEPDKDEKYKVIYDVISKARFRICKENFQTNPLGTYWSVIIYNLEIADSHISELYFKETDRFYPFPKNSFETQQTELKTDKLKVKQIALIHFYEGMQITRENAGEIAAKHGYTAKTSGEGLFQDYIHYCSTANRKAKPMPCTPKKLKYKIELFESIVIHLSDSNKQRAIDEITILKTLYDNEYQ